MIFIWWSKENVITRKNVPRRLVILCNNTSDYTKNKCSLRVWLCNIACDYDCRKSGQTNCDFIVWSVWLYPQDVYAKFLFYHETTYSQTNPIKNTINPDWNFKKVCTIPAVDDAVSVLLIIQLNAQFSTIVYNYVQNNPTQCQLCFPWGNLFVNGMNMTSIICDTINVMQTKYLRVLHKRACNTKESPSSVINQLFSSSFSFIGPFVCTL